MGRPGALIPPILRSSTFFHSSGIFFMVGFFFSLGHFFTLLFYLELYWDYWFTHGILGFCFLSGHFGGLGRRAVLFLYIFDTYYEPCCLERVWVGGLQYVLVLFLFFLEGYDRSIPIYSIFRATVSQAPFRGSGPHVPIRHGGPGWGGEVCV